MSEFRRVSEVELLETSIFRVVRLELTDPGGRPFEREVVRHPGAVTVVPLHDDGTVTLVRQYRAAVDAFVLEAPAGTCDRPGEPPAVTARRELAEEAGLDAAQLEQLIVTWSSPGFSDQRTLIFLARGLTPCPRGPDGIEEDAMTCEQVRLSELERLVAEGTLRDEKTVLGLYLARQRVTDAASGEP